MLIYNASFDSTTRVLSLLDKAGNVISSCEVPSKELVDDITKPLTFKATQDGSTVKLTKTGSPVGAFQTSRDGGNTWEDYTLDSVITLNTGDELAFRAKADRSAQSDTSYFYFKMTGKIEAWHNVMSMIRTNDFATYKSVVDYAFSRLFWGCPSLTKAPVLPATTLADSCYWEMFQSCFSLTEAPALPATTLAVDCYYGMFMNCWSLVKAPELTATTLDYRCFNNMFLECHSLNEVRCKMPSKYSSSDISSSYASNWLSSVSSTGTFYTNADANWPSGASGIPEGWTRVPAVDDITKPLTFKATQDGSTVKLTKKGAPIGAFQTSRDGGNTWSDYTLDDVITLNTGDEVSFRAKADRTSAQSSRNNFYFEMTGKIEAWHNVMSLYRTNDFATYKSVVDYAFSHLFSGCFSLTKAPALPATALADSCYWNMFVSCDSLTEAPELPATKLAVDCYFGMFRICWSLVKAPELPATALESRCYYDMFSSCSKLNEVRIAATTTATDALKNWLSGVSATGDFYCDPNATIFPTGESGIPQNWRRLNIADYPVTP